MHEARGARELKVKPCPFILCASNETKTVINSVLQEQVSSSKVISLQIYSLKKETMYPVFNREHVCLKFIEECRGFLQKSKMRMKVWPKSIKFSENLQSLNSNKNDQYIFFVTTPSLAVKKRRKKQTFSKHSLLRNLFPYFSDFAIFLFTISKHTNQWFSQLKK